MLLLTTRVTQLLAQDYSRLCSYTTTCLFVRLMTAGLVDGLQRSAHSVKSVIRPGTGYAVPSQSLGLPEQ